MSGRRHPSTPDTVHLADLIRRRHDALRTSTGPARAGEVDGVHQARVASRRLRETVPVLGAGLADVRMKSLRRRLRDVTRALGAVRELDVASAMVADLPGDGAEMVHLRDAWRAWLAALRREPLKALRKALAPDARAPLEAQLAELEAAREASGDAQWRTALGERVAVRADALRDRIEATGALYHVEPLHEVRIAAKKLRYALELADEAGLARLTQPLRTIKKAQDILGRLHDLDVLAGLLPSLPDAAPGEHLHATATAVAADLDREARLLHARYLRARTSLVNLADTARDVVATRVRSGTSPTPRITDTDHA